MQDVPRTDYIDYTDPTIYAQRSAVVDRKLNGLIQGFELRPHRRAFIRRIRCEVSDGGPNSNRAYSFFRLIDLAAPTTQQMDIITYPTNGFSSHILVNEVTDCELFLRTLRNAKISFPNLLYLRYVVPWNTTYLIDSWMRMPKLEEIEIYPAIGNFKHYTLQPSGTSIIFPHLHRITIDHFNTEMNPCTSLKDLLISAPNVSFLRIRGDWNLRKDDSTLQAMGTCLSLKTVIGQDEDTWSTGDMGIRLNKFRQVEHGARMEEAAFSWQTTEGEELMLNVSSFLILIEPI